MGHGRGPERLGSSGTSVGLHLSAEPLGGWAEVHHAGRVGSELRQGFEAGAMAPGGLSGFSLFPSLIVRSPHVRPSSGLLVGPWGTRERLSAWGWGSHLARFSSLVFSTPLSSNIASPHLSATPSQSTRLTKQGKYLAKAILRFSLRDNVSSLLFNLRFCLYILSDYGLALSGSYTIIVSQQ